MRKYKVGLTGSAGYIGSNLCKTLINSGRFEVKGLIHNVVPQRDSTEMEIYIGDINNIEDMLEFTKDLDIVIHLAAKLGKGYWEEFYSINVDGTKNVINACVENGVKKFIYISSIEVYGRFQKPILSESDELRLVGHHYVDSKILAEEAVIKGLTDTSVEYSIVRPGMVYGPGSEFWTLRLYKMALNKQFQIYKDGSGNVYPIYIDNLIEGIIKIMDEKKSNNQIYNLVDDENITWRIWGKIYEDYIDDGNVFVKMNPISLFFKGLKNKYVLHYGISRSKTVYSRKAQISNAKIKSELGWYPKVSFAEGMYKCKEWLECLDAN